MKSVRPREPQIVILAAGFSTRLGRPKALAKVHGITILASLSRKLAPLTSRPLAIVVPSRSATGRLARSLGMICVENAERSLGLSRSVQLALAHSAYAPGVLILPVDLTDLRPESLLRMLRRWRAHPRKLVARRLAQRGVIPVLLPRHRFDLAGQLNGDTGLRNWLGALEPDDIILMDMPDAGTDIDTPQDLSAARRRFRR